MNHPNDSPRAHLAELRRSYRDTLGRRIAASQELVDFVEAHDDDIEMLRSPSFHRQLEVIRAKIKRVREEFDDLSEEISRVESAVREHDRVRVASLIGQVERDHPSFCVGPLQDYVEHGELVLALETLCDNLSEIEVPVGARVRTEIVTLCTDLWVPRSYWASFQDEEER